MAPKLFNLHSNREHFNNGLRAEGGKRGGGKRARGEGQLPVALGSV